MASDTLNKTCPMNVCIKLSEVARTQPKDLEPFREKVCRNYLACPQYHVLSGVNKAIIDAVANYNKIKSNTRE